MPALGILRERSSNEANITPAVKRTWGKLADKQSCLKAAPLGDSQAPPAGARHTLQWALPAYPTHDTQADLSLERMMGTPFPCQKEDGEEVEDAVTVPLPSPKAVQAADKTQNETQLVPAEPLTAAENTADPPAASPLPARLSFDLQVDATGRAFDLAMALGGLHLGSGSAQQQAPRPAQLLPLRGLPLPQGRHTRFTEDGSADPSADRSTLLRGLPQPEGRHVRF